MRVHICKILVIHPSREYIPENATRLQRVYEENEELLYHGRARHKRQIVYNIYACVYVCVYKYIEKRERNSKIYATVRYIRLIY